VLLAHSRTENQKERKGLAPLFMPKKYPKNKSKPSKRASMPGSFSDAVESKLRKERELVDLFVVIKGDIISRTFRRVDLNSKVDEALYRIKTELLGMDEKEIKLVPSDDEDGSTDSESESESDDYTAFLTLQERKRRAIEKKNARKRHLNAQFKLHTKDRILPRTRRLDDFEIQHGSTLLLSVPPHILARLQEQNAPFKYVSVPASYRHGSK